MKTFSEQSNQYCTASWSYTYMSLQGLAWERTCSTNKSDDLHILNLRKRGMASPPPWISPWIKENQLQHYSSNAGRWLHALCLVYRVWM